MSTASWDWFKLRLKIMGIDQTRLAENLHVKKSVVHEIRKHLQIPSNLFEDIAEALGVSPEILEDHYFTRVRGVKISST